MALTNKQQRFVEEYVVDFNATQAAIRAGYSTKTAHSTGWENVRKPEIAEAIQAALAERAEQAAIDAEWLFRESEDLYRDCRKANDRRTARGSLDMMGRWLGLADSKVSHEHKGKIEIVSGIEQGMNSGD